MKRLYYIFMLLFFMPPAIAGKYPIITSMKVVNTGLGADYYITQALVEIGSVTDKIPPKDRVVFLGHRHYPGNTFPGYGVSIAYTDGKKNLSQLGIDSYNGGGKGIEVVHHGGQNFPGKECVGYAYNPIDSDAWQPPFYDLELPGGCLIVPPANEWCKITTPELLLEHGTITLKQAEGHVASTSVGVQCTTATAVTFNLITNDKYVYLDEGKSEISVNNQPLDTKIDLPTGDSQMPVKDLLTKVTKEGFHSGSSVLVMMPY